MKAEIIAYSEVIAIKERTRARDELAVAQGRKSYDDLRKQNSIFAGLNVRMNLKAKPPIVW